MARILIAPVLHQRLWTIVTISILCHVIGQAASQLYNLDTPSPDGGLPLASCVYVLDTISFLDPDTGLIDEVSIPAGSLLADSYTTQCAYRETGKYQIQLDPDTQTIRVEQTYTNGELCDAYLPIPTECLGSEYVVATWNPGTTSYIALHNPNSYEITVNISLGPLANPSRVEIDGSVATQTHGNLLQIPSGDLKYVTSSSQSLDGISLSATGSVGVWAGNTGTQVFGFGLESNFLEMFPPTELFSDEYIVPLPPNAVHCVLKVVSLSQDSEVDVTLTDLVDSSPSTTTNTLLGHGDTWSVTHINALHLEASGPVMAIQFHPEASFSEASSMTLIPPTSRWVWSAVLYPLTSSPSGQDEHLAIINIKTNHITGLIIYNLVSGSSVDSITFSSFDQSDYSMASLSLDSSTILLIQHTDYQRFQVIQYGSSADVSNLYAFPATWNHSCPQADDVTTQATTTSQADQAAGSSSSSDTDDDVFSQNYLFLVISGFIFIVSMTIIIGVICIYCKFQYGASRGNNGNIRIEKRSNTNYNSNKPYSNPNPNSNRMVTPDRGDNQWINRTPRLSHNRPPESTRLPRVLRVEPARF